MYLKQNDVVVVIAGAHKGKQGRVIRVDCDRQCVYVQGVNLRYKHMRRTQKLPRGGRIQREAPIHVSNVSLIDPKSNKPTRVGFRLDGDKGRVRYAKRSGEPV
jgi:large subunit ribosomal protein L24